jgi:hypothetical protein
MLNHADTVSEKKLAENHPDQLASQHTRCGLCYDLRKKDVDDPKLALEFTAEQVLRVEESKSCDMLSHRGRDSAVRKHILVSDEGCIARVHVRFVEQGR